ncbi:MAG: hypothetical protein JWN25_2002 [Verrucomicrobiales bacterium]|nr:hypothetical protein [Verrucomicrobiales bacterium]
MGMFSYLAHGANTQALNEVLKLKNAGVDEQTIVSFVQSKSVNYNLSADDMISLQNQGFSSVLVNAMLASGQSNAPQVSVPPLQPSVAPPMPGGPSTPSPFQIISAPQTGSPPPLQVSPDAAYFYQELSPYGRWILAEDNQYYWQPTVAQNTADWRPYWDKGHWVYTENGWYWSSDYSWGWAAFHYGRWQLHPHHGWIWMPDRTWGPSWVVWREGGDYCGWAPLPPGARFDVATGSFLWGGRHVDVNFDFGLDSHRFNFSLVREMGDQPRLRFRGPDEVERVFHETRVVNHYTVVKGAEGEKHPHIVNHGIEVERVNEKRGRPMEQVRIEDLRAPTTNKSHEQLDRKRKTLEVYRPQLDERGRR